MKLSTILLSLIGSCCAALSHADGLFDGFPQTVLSEEELAASAAIVKDTTIRMTSPEVALFTRYLKTAKSYFEFGCGGSTMVASRYGPATLSITSVDSSQEWLDTVARNTYSAAKATQGLLTMKFADIGPIGIWGYPAQSAEESKGAWYLYSQAISMADKQFDVVLVDGRFRVACLLNTFISNPAAKVLIHDFFDPGHHRAYRVLLEVAEVVDRVDTLAALKRKEGVTTETLMKLYATYIHVPDRRNLRG